LGQQILTSKETTMTTTTAHDRRTLDQAPPGGTIVVGIDGSPSSLQALTWATVQAAGQRRGLTLAYAVLPPDSAWIDPAAMRARGVHRDDAGTEAVLTQAREVVAKYGGEVDLHECVRVGDARDVLAELSQEAEQLVIGSRGRGPVRSLLLGSVGVSLSRHAACPVVIHRSGALGRVHGGVVAGVDGSPRSRKVLEYAFEQASLRDLPLTVLHCVWDAQAAAVGPTLMTGGAAAVFVAEAQETVESARLLVAEVIAGFCEGYPEVPVRTELARGMAADALVRMGELADLLVVGSHHGGVAASILLGSVSTDVVEHAHCPVAVVPVA
jgi:nucleotide-binding universal stress UspA family protein